MRYQWQQSKLYFHTRVSLKLPIIYPAGEFGQQAKPPFTYFHRQAKSFPGFGICGQNTGKYVKFCCRAVPAHLKCLNIIWINFLLVSVTGELTWASYVKSYDDKLASLMSCILNISQRKFVWCLQKFKLVDWPLFKYQLQKLFLHQGWILSCPGFSPRNWNLLKYEQPLENTKGREIEIQL